MTPLASASLGKLRPVLLVWRIFAGVLLLNLFVFGIVGWTLVRSQDHYMKIARISSENLSNVLEEGLARFIDKVDLTLLSVIDEIERQKAAGGIDGKELTIFLARHDLRVPEALGLRVVDAAGRLLYAANDVIAPNANVASFDAFHHWQETEDRGLYISRPMIGPVSGKPLIVIARRLDNADGSFAGQVHVAVGLEQLAQMFRVVQLGDKGSVALTDSQAQVIAREPNPSGAAGLVSDPVTLPTLRALISARQTSASYDTRSAVDGVQRTYFFRKLNGQDLYLLVGLADDDTLAEWWREVEHMAALSGLFTLITVIGGVLGYRLSGRGQLAHRDGQ